MKNQFNVGDKVQIRPGTSHCRWGWTSAMARWAREGTVLEVFKTESNSVTVGEYDATHLIEPESLRSVGLSVGDKVRIKLGNLGRLGSHIAERAWKPDGTVLEVRRVPARRGNRVQVEGPDPQSGILISQSIPEDSVERVSEYGTDADPILSPGDKVCIKTDYPGWLLSSIAEQKWKPESTVLEFKNLSSDGGLAVVEGSQRFCPDPITQAVPIDSIERVSAESDDTVGTPSRKPTSLASLEQGTVFVEDDEFLCMKTDESEDDIGHTTHCRCVVVTGEHTGLIRYISENKMVTPKPEVGTALESMFGSDSDSDSDASDPWDLAKTQYGLLEPGDVFRLDQGDGQSCRCFVVALKDADGDYKYIDDDGDLLSGLYDGTIVYRDDVLTDHGL